MKVYAFDFDGTLTTSDTLIAFIRYAHGDMRTLIGFVLFSPLLLLMKLHLYPNWKAKQRVFSYFFGGMPIEQFDDICSRFAKASQHLLRSKGIEMICQALVEDSQVVIVSASIENWVRPFFTHNERLSVQDASHINVIGTQPEILGECLTGRFLTSNCYGQEKVNRLRKLFPCRNDYELIAFGDSRGDKELLDYADQGYFKPFRQ